jgi:hypothetical protein
VFFLKNNGEFLGYVSNRRFSFPVISVVAGFSNITETENRFFVKLAGGTLVSSDLTLAPIRLFETGASQLFTSADFRFQIPGSRLKTIRNLKFRIRNQLSNTFQFATQFVAPARDTAFDRADVDFERLRDFLVSEAFNIA